jgi:hypothetical protein
MPQAFADQFRSIPMSPHLGASLERAHGFAREQGHRAVTLEHLLLAFIEDPDASAVLQASNVELVRLGTDVSGYLGRLLEDMRAMDGTEPQADPELMRVLQAAVQAAQQSRRRQIDGAIVLAAVVGDGKSPAAGLLKAHGMTFEEAIRALQKANAKANAQARSKQFASPPPFPAPTAPVAAPAAAVSTHATANPETARGSESVGQSVDEILAAARARIQQRTAAITGGKAPEPAPEPPPAAPQEPPPLSSLDSVRHDAPHPAEVSAPDDAPQTAPDTAPGPPPPPAAAQAAAAEARPSKTGLVDRAAAAGRLPQPPHHRNTPFSQRALAAGEGPPRPPLPSRPGGPGSGAPPLPGFTGRAARAPWPAGEEPTALNGAHAEAPLPPRRPGPGQRTGSQPGQGPLVETIPRRMRVGVPAAAQVRIGRDRIDSLILLLMKGRGLAHRPEMLASRSLSIRLKAPDGGFWIEAASRETQWAEPVPGGHQPEEQLTWRWTVTPQHRGRGRLVLVVTARTVGQDGLAAEAATPDRVIEVTVSGGRLRRAVRWVGLVAALGVGALVGRFSGELWTMGVAMIKRLLG